MTGNIFGIRAPECNGELQSHTVLLSSQNIPILQPFHNCRKLQKQNYIRLMVV